MFIGLSRIVEEHENFPFIHEKIPSGTKSLLTFSYLDIIILCKYFVYSTMFEGFFNHIHK